VYPVVIAIEHFNSCVDRVKEDNEIRARLARDDPSALDLIWDLYASDLLGYLVGILCSRNDAKDALQDVFVTISKKRTAVSNAKQLKPYLFRMSRNVALNRIKSDKRRHDKHLAAPQWLELNEEGGTRDERTDQIEAALVELPENQRSVVIMKFYREISFREIGEILKLPENTAASRYRYGMAKLKQLLQEISQ